MKTFTSPDNKAKLKLKAPDFFYFNQIVKFKDSFYALGKDHIHIIWEDFYKTQFIE